jgi:hypothetical protein
MCQMCRIMGTISYFAFRKSVEMEQRHVRVRMFCVKSKSLPMLSDLVADVYACLRPGFYLAAWCSHTQPSLASAFTMPQNSPSSHDTCQPGDGSSPVAANFKP